MFGVSSDIFVKNRKGKVSEGKSLSILIGISFKIGIYQFLIGEVIIYTAQVEVKVKICFFYRTGNFVFVVDNIKEDIYL